MSLQESKSPMNGVFSGRKALVIGGSGGIGKAVAAGLAERGAELTIHGGSSKERLANTVDMIREKGGKAEGFLHLIENSDAANIILSRCPAPDILVCAFGPFQQSSLETHNPAFIQKMVDLNLNFPIILVSAALRGMIDRGFGRILLFGGTNTDIIRGYTTSAVYSAAKTGLAVIVKSAARIGAGGTVTCNMVCPGLTETEYTAEQQRLYHLAKSPDGKPIETWQIAQAALAIMENPCVNGAIVAVDKGVAL